MPPEQKDPIAKAKAFLTVGIMGTGLFLLGRHFVNKLKTAKVADKSLDQNAPAMYATRLKMAFDNDNYFGWGTNLIAVRQVFKEIPSKAVYAQVQRAYNAMYRKNLNTDLQDELTSMEYAEMINILSKKKAK